MVKFDYINANRLAWRKTIDRFGGQRTMEAMHQEFVQVLAFSGLIGGFTFFTLMNAGLLGSGTCTGGVAVAGQALLYLSFALSFSVCVVCINFVILFETVIHGEFKNEEYIALANDTSPWLSYCTSSVLIIVLLLVGIVTLRGWCETSNFLQYWTTALGIFFTILTLSSLYPTWKNRQSLFPE